MKKRQPLACHYFSLLRRLACILSVLLLSVPAVSAHENSDTVYSFRFYRGSTKLFVPTFDNDAELSRLEECVMRHRDAILAGRAPLYVDGYCSTYTSEARNLEIARGRSNRVKSELITRRGLKEDNFITRNHSGNGDFVEVRLAVAREARISRETSISSETSETRESSISRESRESSETSTSSISSDSRNSGESCIPLALRANLLRWATLTPDLGVEWRINDHWALALSGCWTTFSWNDKERRYALRELMPEVRYYLEAGNTPWGGYLGLSYKVGSFNYKFSQTGKQGDIMGGGITGGYVLKLNNALSLDFSVGLGYIHAGYDEYVVTDGVRVRSGEGSKNWWGPTNLGVSLVWNLFNK